MSRRLDRPRVGGQIGGTKQRVASLERELSKRQPTVPPFEVPFSLPGPVVVSDSGKARHPTGGRLLFVQAFLVTAGTGSTTVAVYRQGVSLGTLTLGAGSTSARRSFDSLFNAYMTALTVGVTVAGADAEDLTVFCQFDR